LCIIGTVKIYFVFLYSLRILSIKERLKIMVKTTDKSNSERIHIISRKNGWVIKKQGASRATRIYQNKKNAINNARKYLREGHEVIIHNKDGSIQKWEKAE
jgi:hypothetical protein